MTPPFKLSIQSEQRAEAILEKLNFQAMIMSAASAASPTAEELHGSAPRPLRELSQRPQKTQTHASIICWQTEKVAVLGWNQRQSFWVGGGGCQHASAWGVQASRAGSSSRQGGHHVAQKCRTSGRPRVSLSRSLLPSRRRRSRSGDGRSMGVVQHVFALLAALSPSLASFATHLPSQLA